MSTEGSLLYLHSRVVKLVFQGVDTTLSSP